MSQQKLKCVLRNTFSSFFLSLFHSALCGFFLELFWHLIFLMFSASIYFFSHWWLMTIISILLASATVHTTFFYDELMNITESCDGKCKGCLKGADKVVFYCICFNCVNSISSVNHMFCFQMWCLVLKFGQDNVLLEKKFIIRKKEQTLRHWIFGPIFPSGVYIFHSLSSDLIIWKSPFFANVLQSVNDPRIFINADGIFVNGPAVALFQIRMRRWRVI